MEFPLKFVYKKNYQTIYISEKLLAKVFQTLLNGWTVIKNIIIKYNDKYTLYIQEKYFSRNIVLI